MKKKPITFWIMIAVFLVFSAGLAFAQSLAKAPVPKKGKKRVVIEYVSFPDQYKQYEVYPWETLKVEEFRGAFASMAREGKFEEWVQTLTGTAANKNRMIRAFKQQFVLIVACKPHLCDAGQVIVLYDPVRRHAYGLLANDGKFQFFGQPPDDIHDLLNVLLVEEFKAIYQGQR